MRKVIIKNLTVLFQLSLIIFYTSYSFYHLNIKYSLDIYEDQTSASVIGVWVIMVVSAIIVIVITIIIARDVVGVITADITLLIKVAIFVAK